MRSSILCPGIAQKEQNRKREVQNGPEFMKEDEEKRDYISYERTH